MLNIPVRPAVTEPRTVAIVIVPCPYCDTYEQPEDRDGVSSCPNCGYPQTPDALSVEEWEMLITDQAEPTPGVSLALCAGHDIDETGWAHLLLQADSALQSIEAFGPEDNSRC